MLNKGKIIILAVIVASLLFKEGKSTRIKERKTFCYVCDNAANNKECNKNGPIECQPSQSSCLTEIRTIKPTAYSTGSVRITKRCKQDIACNSNERQNIYRSFHNQCNSDPSSRFSVCRHCCKDDKIHGCNKNLEGRGCPKMKAPKHGKLNCRSDKKGIRCKISCKSGFILSNASLSTITCRKDGTWSSIVPRCNPMLSFGRSSVAKSVCPTIKPTSNAKLSCSEDCDGKDCFVGTTCNLQCEDGYISKGPTITSCDSDKKRKSGKWNPTLDKTLCEATRCPSLEGPINGYLECTGSGHNEWCEVVCNAGYLISDFTMSNITCDKAGKWSSDVPRCEAMSNFGRSINFDFVFCEDIFAISHANITCSDDCDGTDCLVGSTCNLRCEDGYISTGPTVTSCKLDTEATLGTWNPTFENTVCKGCPSLQEPINGYLKCSGTGYNKKCEVVCDVGHVISDASLSNVICRENGSWSIDLPRCEAISNFGRSKDFNFVFCDEIATIPHADITCSENCDGVDCLMGTTCSIQCEAGYISNGPIFTSCDPIKGGKSATWNPVIDDAFCEESCKPLEAPANGSIACVNVNETDDVISACRVTCNAGYELVGTEVRFCNKSGLWSGENAKCIVSTVCPKLQPPVNGNMECIGDETIPGGFSCKMSCIPGYILFGDDIRACMSDGTWSGKDTKCNEKRCLTLRRPMNGVLKCVKNKNIETCEIRCTAGYLISDSTLSSISCYNGVWPDHPPRCVRLAAFGRSGEVIGCPQIESIANGSITCSEECNEGNCALGTECNLQCEDGYSSKGPTSTSCDPGEKTLARWIPLLEHTRCEGNVVCTPFKVKNAVVECFGPAGEAGIGSECYITCMYGLLQSGPAFRVCGDDGQWTNDMPTCTASCKPLKSPPNGSITCVDTDEVGEYKSACRFTCDDGYQLIGQDVRYCDTLGIWSGKDSKCLPSTVCPTLRSPINGRIECIGDNSVPGEMSCKISCSSGYKLSGDKLKACLANGTWTGREVTCTEIECPPMNLPRNGFLKCTGNGQNEICQVVCDSGYLISDLNLSNITCNKDGSWSNVVPRCIAVDVSNFGRSLDILFCPELGEVPNGKISCLEECDETGCLLGTVCNLQCEVGYISNGPTFTSCDLERNGKSTLWYPALDNICEKKIGCHPFQVNNGVVECFGPEGESGLGSQCHTTCMYGLSLNGPEVRYCLNNGQWSGYAPICTASFCEDIKPPLNGRYICTPNFKTKWVGTHCDVECFPGFEMVMGSSRRNCLDSGLWDGTPALCAATCEPPQPPPRGSISCVDIAEIDGYTSACRITCDPGFQLVGQDVRLCNTSGIWSGESSKCVVSTTCPVLQTPLNGKIECVGDNSATGKTSCKTSCFPGFSLYGDEIRSCETDGTWSGEETTCVETCSVPTMVKNGEFQCQQIKTNSLYQTFCRLECMTGYRLEGKIFETNCDSTGRWTDMDGMCRRITCPKLPNHDGNTLVCSPGELEDGRFPVGSECRTICNNYKASAHAWQHKKICTDKETWIGPDTACPVDCEWSWSAWSTCGYNGKRTQKVIVGIPSKNGGRQCPQKIINEKECCKVEYASLDGICYTFHCENQTWSAAEKNCKLAGGQLVKVDTIRKHQFLQQIMELKNLPDAWIGLSAKDGEFVWADGDSLGEFHRWFERDGLHKQPDNYRKSEGCVKMTSAWPKSVRYSTNFDWNDVDCYTYANYICERKSDDCKN